MNFQAHTTNKGNAGSLAIISLGSNLGGNLGPVQLTSEAIIRKALAVLQTLSTEPLIASSLYRTAPLDCAPGAPDFINGIALLQPHPGMTAVALLQALHAIESQFGRSRDQVPNQPRCLDLDLISFGNVQSIEQDLVLPHPRAYQRLFVLVPLAEVAPTLKLPGQALTVAEQAQQLMADQQVHRL